MSRAMVEIGATVNVSQYILMVLTWDAGGSEMHNLYRAMFIVHLIL